MNSATSGSVRKHPEAADRISTDDDVDRFLRDPVNYCGASQHRLLCSPRDTVEALQRRGLARRFAQLRPGVAFLKRLAEQQGIDKLEAFDDVLPLLFDHATYKSYPSSLLDKGRFDQLTSWLGKLTTEDLSKVDVSGCRNVDEWLTTLERETPMAIVHTSGTSGTLSFLPWTKADWRAAVTPYPVMYFQPLDAAAAPPVLPLNVPCIYPYFRRGSVSHTMVNDFLVNSIAGSEDNFYAAYPGRLSSDMMLLAARYAAAMRKGQLDQLQVSPELAPRRGEFEAQQRDMPGYLVRFFDTVRSKLSGRRIFMMAPMTLLHRLAERGLSEGTRGIFGADSVIVSGGGGKGIVMPDDWQEPVKEFFGVARIHLLYGMSEMTGFHPMCEMGRYHCPPWIIPFILDPDSGKVLPRSRTVTGCYAFFDLLPDSRWGGFVTGDEVTLTWDPACECGRTVPYVHAGIRRLSDRKRSDSGEEKIGCAHTVGGAYEEALDFLNHGVG